MTPEEIRKVKNETIDEMAQWLTSCIAHVDHDTEVYKACMAMVGGMQQRKEPDPDEPGHEGQHYPLTHKL